MGAPTQAVSRDVKMLDFLTEEIRFLEKMSRSLQEDVMVCMRTLKSNKEPQILQFWSRTQFRAFSSWVEGMTYAMKQTALRANKLGHMKLSDAERSLCDERSYELSDKGRAKDRKVFLKMDANMRFAYSLLARLLRVDQPLDLGGQGYVAFTDSVRIRHRITHPKSSSDIELCVDEARKLQDAVSWYAQTLVDLFTKYKERLDQIAELIGKVDRARSLLTSQTSHQPALDDRFQDSVAHEFK